MDKTTDTTELSLLDITDPALTNDLTGPSLNWAVAAAQKSQFVVRVKGTTTELMVLDATGQAIPIPNYASDPAASQRIVEGKRISSIWRESMGEWWACRNDDPLDDEVLGCFGPTAQIAAMRAWVLHELGDTVNVPFVLSAMTLPAAAASASS